MNPESNRPIAVSYYLSHPIQYFSPLLRVMARHFNLHVYYYSDVSIRGGLDKGFGQKVKWDIPLLDGYESSFIRNYSRREALDNHFWDVINPGVVRALRRDPSKIVIVNGWSYFSTLLTIFTARLLGKKVWVRAENTYSKELTKGKLILFLKRVFLKHFLFRLWVNQCLYIGEDSRAFFRYYGVKDRNLIFTPYAVDNEYFRSQFNMLREQRDSLKRELGLPTDRLIFLFTGKYMAVKRPLDLIDAFSRLSDLPVSLVMVGDGPLRSDMEERIRALGLQNIYLTGFVNQSQIARYYAIGDVFVLCSQSETWGLSVNEAMNFEMPVVVSDTVGCAQNLVAEGETGFTFPMGNPEALAGKLRILAEDRELRCRAGQQAGKRVLEYNFEAAVNNMLEFAAGNKLLA